MSKGLIPGDMGLIGSMVQDICYFNAKRYFRFPDRAGSPVAATGEARA
jgi:tetrahydromethanopterin S-methyltransferase subunit E